MKGYVGKVNMDRNSPDILREESAEASAQATEEWIQACEKFEKVKPILTPRFTPSVTDELFEKVYGKCKVIAEIRNEQAKVLWIEPQDLLLAGFSRILETYKGVPYRNEQDLFKIKVVGGIKNGNKRKNKKNIHRHN